MNLNYIFDTVTLVFRVALLITALFCIDKLIYIIVGFFPGKKFPKAAKNYKYALLIPARNESKVIEALLQSIEAQTYPKELMDVFVVVEDINDPTVKICAKYGAKVTVRKRLDLKTKGYALGELLEDMYEKGCKYKYNAYFVFDADNYLSPTYMEEMNKAYGAGYDVGVGYRNSKNWNDGWVSSCSALSFSILNSFHNKLNSRVSGAMMISGTGFYIDARVIDDLGGWKFVGLTEDIELSFFASLNNLKSTYCTKAEFFDEQPSKFKMAARQRTRWLRGYFQAAKIYHKKIIANAFRERNGSIRKLSHVAFITPAMAVVALVGLYGFFSCTLAVCAAINSLAYKHFLYTGLSMFGYIYLALFTFNLLCLLVEIRRIDISFKNALSTILFGPVFLFWYAPIFFFALFKKEIKWDTIEHNVSFSIPENPKK